MKNILIAGGSGLIGKQLTKLLIHKGYSVGWLTHSAITPSSSVQLFRWNLENEHIDKEAIDFADAIINLAGTGIAEKPWTAKRKQEIVNSRVNSIELLMASIKASAKQLHCFVSASAIGYYGNKGDKIVFENEEPAADFLGQCCITWENAADEVSKLNIRTVKLRTGIVLSKQGGALPKILRPLKLGLGAALGNGNQWMSWIHIVDLCNMYIYAIENQDLTGTFNATAPNPVTNFQFNKIIAESLNKSIWLPNVPEFVLSIALGNRKQLLLDSTRCSSRAIAQTGFKFSYPEFDKAIKQLLSSSV
ncbi:TIGR01777 family oxidoreductase [Solitalea longa]|nr:TIGR01777 family oxidoreductase [Solitalea longa]